MFIGTFLGDPIQFIHDVDTAVKEFKSSGVTNVLIDVTNNGGPFTFFRSNQGKSDISGRRWNRLSWIVPSSVPCWD